MDRPLQHNDPELHELLLKQIEALASQFADDFPGQVRSVLRTALLTDHAGLDQIARLFAIHSRTLIRRLSDFGTSFQEFVDEGRFEIARQMLDDPRVEVGRIAAALDYADASAFTRAFRRWSGTTPSEWRAGRKVLRSHQAR